MDFSETNNLAEQQPDRLEKLVSMWREEAERYDVLPLDDDTLKLYRNSVPPPRATYLFYPGMTRLDRLSAPDIYTYNSRFTAEVRLSEAPANGVILAAGDSSCGYEWFIDDGFMYFGYVFTRNTVYSVRSRDRVPPGTHALQLTLRKTSESTGLLSMLIDDSPVAELVLENMWPIYAANAGIRCGENRHAPITRAYKLPFVFDQHLERAIVDVDLV
jgi:arylsulfatase